VTYTVEIQTEKDKNLHALFQSEETVFPNGRAQYTTKITNNHLIIDVEAQDTSSLKAVFNSITTVLEIYEESRKLTE